MDPNDISTALSPKSFWKKPEGLVGMVLTAAVVAGIGVGLFYLLPFVMVLLENIIYTCLLFGAAAFLVMIMCTKRFWTLGGAFIKYLSNALTGAFIPVGYIAILTSYVEKLQKRKEELDEQKGALRGSMVKLQQQINENKGIIDKGLNIVQAARTKGAEMVAVQNARAVDRKQKSNVTYADMYAHAEQLYKVITKYSEASQFYIDDISDEVHEMIQQKQIMDQASGAMSLAKRILSATGDDTALYNETREFMKDDYAKKLGQIEDFMDESKPILQQLDIMNEGAEAGVFAQLDAMSKQADALVLESSKPKAITASADSIPVPALLGTKTKVPVASGIRKDGNKFLH